jgi:aspartate/methionine/tyrosine aminotransferase
LPVELPAGAFYLWLAAPDSVAAQVREGESPGFALGRRLAAAAGVIGSPGEAYGPLGWRHLRLAAVQPMERLKLVESRLVGRGAVA